MTLTISELLNTLIELWVVLSTARPGLVGVGKEDVTPFFTMYPKADSSILRTIDFEKLGKPRSK